MSTLPEIEAAVESLPMADKQQLLLFLASQLRMESGQLPAPRHFTREQLQEWIDQDEADLARIRSKAE